MKFTELKIQNEGQGKWIITVEGEEYKKILNKAQNRAKSKIEIPGFRKGKAPVSEVEKHLTPTRVYSEAYQYLIKPAFDFALTQRKVEPMNSPEPKLAKVNDQLIEIEFVFDLPPNIKLGQYKGISKINKETPAVSDEEINAEIKKYQERFAMEKNRADGQTIHEGDNVTFDFQGMVDGKPFNGGEAKDYKLVIGSNQFIPGFENSMIGLGLGKHQITVTFPENYSAELSGKECVFELDIKAISERILPDFDEELIKDLNIKGITTVEELKAKIQVDLLAQKTQNLKISFVNQVVDEIIKTSEIDLPKSAIEHQIKELKKEFEQEVIRQGLTLKDYKKLSKMTDADIEREISQDAIIRLQSYLVTNEIRRAEKIEIDPQKLETKYQEFAELYKIGIEKLKELLPETSLRDELLNTAINDFLYENNGQ